MERFKITLVFMFKHGLSPSIAWSCAGTCLEMREFAGLTEFAETATGLLEKWTEESENGRTKTAEIDNSRKQDGLGGARNCGRMGRGRDAGQPGAGRSGIQAVQEATGLLHPNFATIVEEISGG